MADVEFPDLPIVTEGLDADYFPFRKNSTGDDSRISYADLQKMAKGINLLGGASALSVWSQSDTNKGLSRDTPTENVGVDSGSVIPVVGETLTGVDSGAVGKVISITDTGGVWTGPGNSGTATLSLGACAGRFHDNEDLDGDVGGANICTLNMPPTAAGVDGVRNGSFTVDEDPPQGWTASNATLSTEAGGAVGNCMKVLDGGAGNGYGYQQITTAVGKLYTFRCWARDIDGGQNGLIEIGTAAGGAQYYSSGAITDNAGAYYVFTFEATTTTTYISLNCTSAAGAYYFDSVSLYEITPCCTEADTKGPDGWYKQTTLDVYREHKGNNTKDGSFYSLKCVPTLANDFILTPPNYTTEPHLSRRAGRTLAKGFWVKTSVANHARVRFYDSVNGLSYSAYHTGGGNFEWLKATTEVAAASTNTSSGVAFTQSSGIAYVAQPVLIFGSSIGEGNYVLAPGSVVHCDPGSYIRMINSASPLAADDKILNVEALSEGEIPKGCKALYARAIVKDSAVADAKGIRFGATNTASFLFELFPAVNNMAVSNNGVIPCDANGDIYQSVTTVGDTLSGMYLDIFAVQIS